MLKSVYTDEVAVDQGIKMLVFGPAGSGKTSLIATAPTPIIFSAEAGLLPLRKFRIPAYELATVADMYEAYQWVSKSQEAQQYQTVCIDSISELAEIVLSEAKKATKDPRQAYGVVADTMIDFIKSFRNLVGKHVYMTAKMSPEKDEYTGVTKYIAMMPGKQLGPQVPHLLDEVFRLDTAKSAEGVEYRFLQTYLDAQYICKDRSGALDPIEEPNLTNVFNKILGVTS